MSKVFVDTSAWAALFNKKDDNFKAAVKVWEDLKRQDALLFTTDYVIDELLTLLKARAEADIAVNSGDSILASKVIRMIRVTDEIFSGALEVFKKYKDHSFSFTDCTSSETMKRFGIGKVFTFDHDFKIMGYEILGGRS